VSVHAKSCLTPEPLRTLRSETKGQAAACPDRTQAIPCKLRGRLLPMACAELTATVTATAAANGYQQRPVTAHNARTIRANWGYVRPEKRKVVRRRRPTENLACALPARAPEMPPNYHQQPTIATGSHLRT
jgi:hypothetical protein